MLFSTHTISASALGASALLLLTSCGATGPAAPKSTPTAQVRVERPTTPHWDYGAEHGPASWGDLCPEFAACKSGKAQSPIDLIGVPELGAPALITSYVPAALRIVHHEHVADVVNNGHSVQVDYPESAELRVGGKSYKLLQFHFHSPSEHTVNGRSYPMEMHLVHKAENGELAVLGVLLEEGPENELFAPLFDHLPTERGVRYHYDHVKVDVDALLPANRTCYRYQGSLTTPPCSESVAWFVLANTVSLSPRQIQEFRAVMFRNNRPPQALNERRIALDSVEGR
jgi:carbonic anhydrase